MQRTKKVISALLAVVMLVSVLSISVSAGAPAPSGSYKISIVYELCDADGNAITTVTPGQEVTLNVYGNSSTDNDELVGFVNSIYYDDEVYTYVPDSVQWLGVKEWIDANNSKVNVYNETHTNINVYTKSAAAWTDTEKADHPNWASFLYVTGTQLLAGSAYTVKENANTPMYSLKFKVADNVAPGTNADFGCPESVHLVGRISYNYVRTKATGTIGAGEIEPMATYSVAAASEAVAGPALSHVRRELKMDVQDGAVVKGTEQLRVTSAISQADWDAYFANTTTEGATANAIQQVGIVAFKGQAADFNADTAKAVAQGTPADGYSAADTDYIQNDTASGTYKFGARIEYQSAAFDTTYIAYVKYLDAAGQVAYAFYDTTTTYSLNFATDYTNLTNGYISWLATQA